MNAGNFQAIADRAKAQIVATQTGEERIALLVDYIRAVAEEHARTVFLALDHEADLCAATEEPHALRHRLLDISAQAGRDLARCVGSGLCPASEDLADREPFEHLAAVSYKVEFDRLLLSGRAGGKA